MAHHLLQDTEVAPDESDLSGNYPEHPPDVHIVSRSFRDLALQNPAVPSINSWIPFLTF
jgi:hypothetical protein